MRDHVIRLSCEAREDDWRCLVTIGDDPRATQHEVTVTAFDVARVAPLGTPVETVVKASFAFLLDHEPRESILRRFDLRVISRYFPDYETEIRQLITR